MRVSGVATSLFAPARVARSEVPLTGFERLGQFRLANQRMLDLRRLVQRAQRIVGPNPLRGHVNASQVQLIGRNLGLSSGGTRSLLASSEQVNAATTSFDDRTPTWQGASTAVITLDGTYNGTTDDTLTFKVVKDATLPTNQGQKVEVYDSAGVRVDNVQVGAGYVPGDPITLASGLVMRISSGTLVAGDQTNAVNVLASQDSEIVASNPLGGTGDLDAVLQDGYEVVDGSFDLNGTTIDVFATDSLDDVLARINAAGLGLTATYDSVTERVSIQADAVGPTAITVSNDTSGLIAALKLDGASTVVGTAGDSDPPINQVAAFSSVVDGIITINGVGVNVMTATDSLGDVLAEMNAIVGVTAGLVDGRVVVSGDQGETLEVSDTTGLLSVLDIAVGTHEAVSRGRGFSRQKARDVASVVRDIAAAIDAFLVEQLPGPTMASGVRRLRTSLGTEVASVLGDELTGLGGMSFDFSTGPTRGVHHTSIHERRLARLLDQGDDATFTALFGDGGDEVGLLERLDDFTRLNIAGLREVLGSRIDVLA